MAALPAGVQYGLSSEASYNGNKNLMFVKLTDSALRSIEEFVRNTGKIGATPKIQFLPDNQGKISIPNAGPGTHSVTYEFSFANNTDLEAQQGSFECLQQSGYGKPLRALGAMPNRMRVHANDDVYAATKQRMTVDAEQLKSKCTRVIKPNQTDIGRKVKVKQQQRPPPPPRAPPSPLTNPNNSHSHSSHSHPNNHNTNNHISNNYHNNGGGGGTNSNSNSNGSLANNGAGYNSNHNVGHNGNHISGHNVNQVGGHNGNQVGGHSFNGNSNGHSFNQNGGSGSYGNQNGTAANNHSGHNGYNGHGGQPKPAHQPPQHPPTAKPVVSNPDLFKRPIKERLIQLLALRPYKKPDLYNRIKSEGLKDKEKSVLKTVLQQVSSMKENCIHLHRHLWNDVNPDWPFYTDEEKQILKSRKPQNLTPPLSSDSGHSPSPPPPAKRSAPPPMLSNAHPHSGSNTQGNPQGQGIVIVAAPPPIKKQRISHYKKPNTHDSNSREGESSPAALSNGYHSSTSTSGASSGERKNYSDEDTPPPPSGVLTPSKRENGYSRSFGSAKNFVDTPTKQNGYQSSPPAEPASYVPKPCSPLSREAGSKRNSPVCNAGGVAAAAVTAIPNPPSALAEVVRDKSPDSTTRPPVSALPPSNPDADEDYISQYTPITCQEQRRQYKADFAVEHKEYCLLYTKVEAVREVFRELEERLHQEMDMTIKQEIKCQIVEEYHRTKGDTSYQRSVAHFSYLHRKLAHIKGLVKDFDDRNAVATPLPAPVPKSLAFY